MGGTIMKPELDFYQFILKHYLHQVELCTKNIKYECMYMFD